VAELDLEPVDMAVSPAEKYREFLATKGLRMTRERSIIVDEVFSSHEHFDAEQLIQRLARRSDGRRVSRSTIYRSLKHLEDAGLIRKVARQEDRDLYEHDYGYPHHDHLICNRCGNLIEFHNDDVSEILEQIAPWVPHGGASAGGLRTVQQLLPSPRITAQEAEFAVAAAFRTPNTSPRRQPEIDSLVAGSCSLTLRVRIQTASVNISGARPAAGRVRSFWCAITETPAPRVDVAPMAAAPPAAEGHLRTTTSGDPGRT
jgi:Fur family ferric uptake transcriptional regulator